MTTMTRTITEPSELIAAYARAAVLAGLAVRAQARFDVALPRELARVA